VIFVAGEATMSAFTVSVLNGARRIRLQCRARLALRYRTAVRTIPV
jgi:hypothetical protein